MPAMKKKEYGGPMGGAGLIRYFDVDEGGPKMDPRFVIGIIIGVILLELLITLF